MEWGRICGPSIVLSDDRLTAWRNNSTMSHAVLSSRCLRGRVRFEMLIEERQSYLQLGVCWAHELRLDAAVTNRTLVGLLRIAVLRRRLHVHCAVATGSVARFTHRLRGRCGGPFDGRVCERRACAQRL